MKSIVAICLTLVGTTVFGQLTFNDSVTKNINFETQSSKNVLYVANINGSITAKPASGSQIKVTAKRYLKAKTQTRLDVAKELSLGIKDRYDTMIVYISGACGTFSQRNGNWNGSSRFGGWGYNWRDCEDKFDFKFDITVEVPAGQNLILSTVNKGDVKVGNLKGDIQIRNVNGGIRIKNAEGSLTARTINGDVVVQFKQTPSKWFSLYTLNGDIKADYPSKLNADVNFKSYNGEFYTNENVSQIPLSLKREEIENRDGIKYKIRGESIIRFNQGGFEAKVETFNGDVFLRNLALKN